MFLFCNKFLFVFLAILISHLLIYKNTNKISIRIQACEGYQHILIEAKSCLCIFPTNRRNLYDASHALCRRV